MSDILIYDRDRTFARSLETFFTGSGYTVETFDVGSRAVQKLLSGLYGVVVLGVHIDDVEELEIIPIIHQIDRELPVVAVGDGESLEMERKVRLKKVFYYMVQPVDLDEMTEVVRRAIEGREDRGIARK